MNANTVFNKIESAVHGHVLTACPLCGSPAEMWERVEIDAAAKTVSCSHGDQLASMPHDGLASAGCPMYSPPEGFYRATYREAAKTWNDAAAEFAAMRNAKANASSDGEEVLRLLLDEVRQCFTRDDDLPGDLLPRIDAAIDPARRDIP